jgi:DNA-nicking Smr family endonuclease
MTRRRDLSPDEAKLWRRVAKTAKPYKPVPPSPAVSEPSTDVTPKTRRPVGPELPHLALERARKGHVLRPTFIVPSIKRPGAPPVVQLSGHKKVRRGKLEIDARLDLHGMRQIEAQAALLAVIARTRAQNGRCILVVTGKGQPTDPGEDFLTPQPGVIRRRFPEWLSGAGVREHVSGYAPAAAKDGGSGAFYVLLKSNQRKL